MHNLELTEDQTMILDTVRRFVADTAAPGALVADEHRRFVRPEFDGLAEIGLLGLALPEDRGGAGMGLLPLAVALEEIAGANASLARLLVEQTQCALALQSGSDATLEGILAGTQLAAFLGPEHGITATADAIDGVAELVPAGAIADLFVIAATEGDHRVLLVADSSSVQRQELSSLGLRSSAPARVAFAGNKAVRVLEGNAADLAIGQARTAAWIGGAALAIGLAQASIAGSRKHASERIAFGKPLLAQQAVSRKLVEARRATDAARHLVYHAARLADLGMDATAAAMQARIAAVDAAVLAADEGIQIHGGFGYVVEYHVERHYRDAKTLEVLDGGNDALRDRLAVMQFA